MSVYIYPIRQAAIIFIGIVAVVFIPFMIQQYRKYGSVSSKRSLILYGFLFYMICAYFLVILPLPEPGSVHTSYREMMQLRPFQFVLDFFKETTLVLSQPSTYLRAMLQGVVIQPIFNIFLTIPFGMFLRYYFNFSFKKTFLCSLLLAFFFELTQLSGLYGIYSGPYRLFDVDDLMLNTLGGVVGYGMAPLLTVFFPTRETLDHTSYRKGEHVTYVRRLVAYFVDMMIVRFLASTLLIGIHALNVNGMDAVIHFVIYMLYFTLYPYAIGSGTLGQRFLKIEVASYDGELHISQLIIRSLLVYIFFEAGPSLLPQFYDLMVGFEQTEMIGPFVYLGILFGWYMFLIIHTYHAYRKNQRHLFYDTLSKTELISTIERNG